MNRCFLKVHVMYFIIILASSCIKDTPMDQPSKTEQTNSAAPEKIVNKKSVNQILDSYRGGTIDLREKTYFTIDGIFPEDKLLETNITIRGNGTLILKSGSAFNLKNSAKEVYLGINKFKFIEVEEYYQGSSVFTKYKKDQMSSINYKLKL